MEKIICEITKNILKDKIEDDINKKYESFKKTKEYQSLLKKRIIDFIENSKFIESMFEEYTEKEILKILKEIIISKEIKDIFNTKIKQYLKEDNGEIVADFFNSRDIWKNLYDFFEKNLTKVLKEL